MIVRRYVWHLARIILVSYVGIAVGLIFWHMVRASDLVIREDNPRLVLAAQRIHRGSLLDAAGEVVAYSELDPETERYWRRYPVAETVPVVGYYSLRYGMGAAEAAFDDELRGSLSFLETLLHQTQRGSDVELSLDAKAQRIASDALGSHHGAVIVVDVSTGEVPVLVSHPLFDPNLLETQWDELTADPTSPLLNRATQGSYPVGDMARWVGLTGLLSIGATVPREPAQAPLDELIAPLSQEGYLATCRQLGFDQPVPLELQSGEGRLLPLEGKTTVRDVAVTPAHLARWMAGVAADGALPVLTIGKSSEPASAALAFSPMVAAALRDAAGTYGDLAGWVGTASELETGTASLCWLVGYWPKESPRYAIALVVEGCGMPDVIAVPIAQSVLSCLD
jgi:cell division protein FtsI/penicillin-binding protein 2